jgi:hypothetical protein
LGVIVTGVEFRPLVILLGDEVDHARDGIEAVQAAAQQTAMVNPD